MFLLAGANEGLGSGRHFVLGEALTSSNQQRSDE